MLLDFSNEILKMVDRWGDKATLSLETIQNKDMENRLCLCVKVPDIENFVPVLTMESYYMEYQNGTEFESIANEIEDIICDIISDPLSLILKVLYFKI